MKIIIDPGHGGSESGAVAFGLKEKDLNLVFASLLADKLEKLSLNVDRSILNDNYYDSKVLTDMIKNSGASLCISCHNNAANGNARGLEVIYSIKSDGRLANKIIKEVSKTGYITRRAYSRKNITTGQDYYFIIRLTQPGVETIIIEFGFLDNENDFALITSREWQEKLTDAVVSAIIQYLPSGTPVKTPISGKALLTAAQLKKALNEHNPTYDSSIVDLYYTIALLYNIKPDLAFLQAVHETGWFKFTGIVEPWQNNFAGIGATGGSNAGASFPSKEIGVEAHLQHLYAYCSKNPVPAGRPIYDPRFGLVGRGSAPNIEDLNGKWAVPGIGYGEKILSLQKLIFEKYPANVTETPEQPAPLPVETQHWAKKCNDELLKAGLLDTDHSKTLDNYATEGMVICLINRLRKESVKDE